MTDSIAEVIAWLDQHEQDLLATAKKVREYRYILFAAYTAQQSIDLNSPCTHGRRFCVDCHSDDVLD